jgi:hypothetical protein
MVLEGITSTSLLVRAALIPTPVPAPRSNMHSPAKSSNPATELGPWLPHCVSQVVTLHRSLGSLDLPNEALVLVVNLIQELRLVAYKIIINTVHFNNSILKSIMSQKKKKKKKKKKLTKKCRYEILIS